MMNIEYLIKKAEESLLKAEEAIADKKGFGTLVSYSNCMYNIGRFHAYMDAVDELDSDKWCELYAAYKNRIHELEEAEDAIYSSLKRNI